VIFSPADGMLAGGQFASHGETLGGPLGGGRAVSPVTEWQTAFDDRYKRICLGPQVGSRAIVEV
jgi:hypothetical protein